MSLNYYRVVLLSYGTSMSRREFLKIYSAKVLSPDENGISQAAELIRSGKLVAFPTETVYGLGANALNAHAVSSIFEAKGRPLTDPLIVHVPEFTAGRSLLQLSAIEERVFEQLTSNFWPGFLGSFLRIHFE